MSITTVVWRRRLCCSAIGALALGLTNGAQANDSLAAALTGSKVSLDLRYRYETVAQDNTLKDAKASTLRTALGYTTGSFFDFAAMVEFENVSVVGVEQYNSSVNGKTQYATVLDPAGTEVNQAYLRYAGGSDTVMNLGRQRLMLDNQRFVGNVGWRQNEQTFDGFTLVNKGLSNTLLTYAYLSNVNRVVGDESPAGNAHMGSHLINANYSGLPIGVLTGYGYFLDFDKPGTVNAILTSTQTLGLRLVGKQIMNDALTLLYTAEYARQRDYKNNPAASGYDVNYLFGEFGASYRGVTVKYGYERLGSDGTHAVQTPLATLHAFNGWADMFAAGTPAKGLVDQYVSVGGKLMAIDLAGVYHEFAADKSGTDYGTEWDLVGSRTFEKRYTLGLKYAAYNADAPAAGFASNVDTSKFWLWGEVKF